MLTKNLLRGIVCGGFAVLVMGNPALAQVMLEQGRITAQVRPGEKTAGAITAINRSDNPLTLRVYLEDFVYTAPYRGSKEFLPSGTEEGTCAPWISFSPGVIDLGPRQKAKINYVIDVPPGARGGYNAVLFVENAGRPVDAQVGIKIVTRVGSLFFLETPDSVRKAEITDVALTQNTFAGKITNQGNVITVIRGTYYLLDREGMAAERGEVETLYLPSSQTADFSFLLPPGLAAGTYTLVLTFDLGQGVSAVVEMDFIKKQAGSTRVMAVRS